MRRKVEKSNFSIGLQTATNLAFTSLKESDNLSDPDVLAQEIIDDLEAGLERFREIATDSEQESLELKKC